MRLAGLTIVFCFVSGVAAAQIVWQTHKYEDMGFSVVFPIDPKNPNNIKIENGIYRVSESNADPKSTTPARIYSVTLPTAIFKVTVADFSKQTYDGSANLLGQAVNYLTDTENLLSDTSTRVCHRLSAVYGRDVTYDRKDGGRSTMGFFFTKGRLYVIEAIIFPSHDGGDVGSSDAVRFQQSISFTGDC